MKMSSSRRSSASRCAPDEAASAELLLPTVVALGIEPLVPVVRELGPGWVAVEEEVEDLSEEGKGVSLAKVLGDDFEAKDPSERADNNPEVRQRLRTFHIV